MITAQQELFVQTVAEGAQAMQAETGISAALTIAQAILESGWGSSELARMANNLFGMKISLSGNSWEGSAWDGKSYYSKASYEYEGGRKVLRTSKFRSYPSISASIRDHAFYLLNARNGSARRYAGISGADYKTAAKLLQRGGYATDPAYADQVCGLVERYGLDKYDKGNGKAAEKIQQDQQEIQKGKIMKYNVHAGHNFHAPGAGGQFSETSEDRKVKDKVIALLRAQGHTVYDCTDEDGATASANLRNIVKKCNAHMVDLDVSIHFNAFNGTAHGTEVLVYSDTSSARAAAVRICSKIAALGFTNRGIKYRPGLYVLRNTDSPALLIECCFCDSKADAKIYDREKMAKAIVEGILNKSISTAADSNEKGKDQAQAQEPTAEPVTPASPAGQIVRVRTPYLRIRAGAGTDTEDLGYIPPGLYTVTETSKRGGYTWGRLKSGAGWIAMEYTEPANQKA